MKNQLLFLLISIVSFNCFSQISFEKGYYINNNDQKINCLIKNLDWDINPTKIEFKLSNDSKPETLSINSVKEFSIYDFSKYVRSTVNIDKSSEITGELTDSNNPDFQKEQLFLKVLVDGKATLYQYFDTNLLRFFFRLDDSDIKQLIYKKYKTQNSEVATNNGFKQQLWINLKCSDFKVNKVERLKYLKNDLVKFFVDYNNCINEQYVNFDINQKKDLFNLRIRPRLNNSSLSIQNSNFYYLSTNYEKKKSFGLGVESEFILPFNKNKWAIIIEPTYQSYKEEQSIDLNFIAEGVYETKVDYTSVEIPIGLRQYFFISSESKIFINASYVFNLSLDSKIEFSKNDASEIEVFEFQTLGNFAFGVGYEFNDKFSLEYRYQTARDISTKYAEWDSQYKSMSLILGYSFF